MEDIRIKGKEVIKYSKEKIRLWVTKEIPMK